MDFREADRRWADVKRRYDNGLLGEGEFDAQLEQIMVEDAEGRWWAKHRDTGEWHYHDGTTWVRGTPPGYDPGTVRDRSQEQQSVRPSPVTGQPPTRSGAEEVRPPGADVPGYLLPASIAATVLCCLPTGVSAIVYSAQARSKSQAGDTAGASQAVKNANIWLVVSVALGLVVGFFVLASSDNT